LSLLYSSVGLVVVPTPPVAVQVVGVRSVVAPAAHNEIFPSVLIAERTAKEQEAYDAAYKAAYDKIYAEKLAQARGEAAVSPPAPAPAPAPTPEPAPAPVVEVVAEPDPAPAPPAPALAAPPPAPVKELSAAQKKIQAAKEATAATQAKAGAKGAEGSAASIGLAVPVEAEKTDPFAEANELRDRVRELQGSGKQLSKSKSAQLAQLKIMEQQARGKARAEVAKAEEKAEKERLKAEEKANPSSSSSDDKFAKVTGITLPSVPSLPF